MIDRDRVSPSRACHSLRGRNSKILAVLVAALPVIIQTHLKTGSKTVSFANSRHQRDVWLPLLLLCLVEGRCSARVDSLHR